MSARPSVLAAFDAVPAPIVVLDRHGIVAHWNRACEAVAPLSLEEARGRALAALCTDEQGVAAVQRALDEVHVERPPVSASWRWTSREGVARVLAWSISASIEGSDARVVAVASDVSARETELASLRTQMQQAPVAIVVSDTSGRYTDVNEAACRLVGRTREEIIGSTILELIAPEEAERWFRAREEFLVDQTSFGVWRLRHADGTDVPIELSARVLPDGQWQAFMHDLRDRLAQEQERERLLRESEADRRWLRAVLETVPAGVLLFDRDGMLTFNRHAESIFGLRLSPGGGSAQYASRVLHPDGTPVTHDELVSTRVLRTGEPMIAVEQLVEREDGTRVPILGSAAPIRDERGATIGAVGVFQDVSERMRAQEAIRTNERLLDGIFELLPVGVWIADRTGRIVRTNPAGLRVWQGARYVGPSEFDQYVAWWADTGEQIEGDDWALARALRDGETSIGEILRIRCFDGSEKTILNSAMPLRDEHGGFAGAIVVNEDVTALREIEDELRRAVLARDEVLGFVAHDLRSPLNAIVMQLHLLRRHLGPDERVERALALIHRQTSRLDRTIQELLDVARAEAGRLTVDRAPLDVRSLVEDVVEPRRPAAAEASIEIAVEIDDEAGELQGDRERLGRVLDNLIGNAMKFAGPNGRIVVRAARSGHDIVFSVSDTGPGIPEEQLVHVFERFWQERASDRRGVGLGLAIVRAIVEAHCGRVWVESRVGAGTTFSFSLPQPPWTRERGDAP